MTACRWTPRGPFCPVRAFTATVSAALVLTVILGMAAANEDKTAPARPVHIVTLGDSITKGVRSGVTDKQTFAALLDAGLNEFRKLVRVTNVGIGGERTDQALKRLSTVLALKPDFVTIMYGTNDSAVDRGKKSSRLSSAKYRANLVQIVNRLKAAGIAPVLMTEPCMGDAQRLNGVDEHPNVSLAKFTNHCRRVAGELDVPLVDHFRYWTRQNESGIDVGQWTTDQCHPNPKGHRQIAARILPTVSFALAQARIAAKSTEKSQ